MLTGPALTLFRKSLLTWFAQFQRKLPWRQTRDPYRVWLSEIMLQQTRVAAAIPYYERFLEHFPNVESLASAQEEEVLRLWSGLGYYSRVRNLRKTAKLIVAKHNGIFPSDPAEALALPGIGAYTAAAILSIAYQKKHAVLDGNVARVIARLDAVRSDLRANGTWQTLQKSADHLLQERSPGDWNQAMMELGATLCTPRSPQCLLCPVSEFCEARKQGLVEVIPEKRSKRATIEITLASLVLVDPHGKTLLLPPPKSTKKSAPPDDVHTLVSRMWHFPTVSVQNGQAAAALAKFAQESFFGGRKFQTELAPLKKVRHAVTYRSITILPFRLEMKKLPKVSGAKVFPLADLSGVAISNLTRKVARAALAPK
jgi:A/G-specific adenine glycosylase